MTTARMPAGIDIDLVEQAHAALRRARHEAAAGPARGAPRLVAVEAVDVLLGIDRADDRVAVEMRGSGIWTRMP